MGRPTTRGSRVFGPKAVGAFVVGVGIGLALVSPVLPDAVLGVLNDAMAGGGLVILVGVGALGALMVLLALSY